MKRFVAALLTLLVASAASAEPIAGSKVNLSGWIVDAHTDKAGSFSHCAVSTNYRSGISMIFTISHDFRWSVGWTSATWKFEPGQKVELSLNIDDQGPTTVMAKAITSDFAMAGLPDSLDLFNRFRNGNRLIVIAQGNRYGFNLDGSYAALTEAHACVKRYIASAPAKAPPPMIGAPAKLQPVKPSGEQVATERRLEATTFAANLLAQGDLAGFHILSAKEREDPALKPFEAWEVIWVSEDILGALRIAPSAKSSSQLASVVMGVDSTLCRDGQFASGTSVDEKNSNVSRLFTSCRTGKTDWTARYVMIPRQEGGFYLIGTFLTDKDKPADGKVDDVDGLLRASVFNVLKKK
jgi:hypothetical protein